MSPTHMRNALGNEARYRIKARALYAILRGVIDMHPLTSATQHRCLHSKNFVLY
jgi:hypothetical protein